ncbi:MAG: class I SAM-dependent methyltransferase [Deltaproteobacteria bacterium]|nr:class I SAM-dependent methyltransferase [Deltaproteobacteria bacterium]
MLPALYDRLVPWYYLLDATADHAEEAAVFAAGFREVIGPGPATLLELGAGAGNNAWFLKREFACTLGDLSPAMLTLSQALNPECAHVVGDLRTLRLGQAFDAVLIHDAIAYVTTEADLRAAAATAFAHTRPGGAAIIAPDCTRETFVEQSALHEGADGERALRCLEWMWDPDPADTSYTVEYAFLLRDGAAIEAVHDRHVEGLFPRATWVRVFTEAGFVVGDLARPLGDGTIEAFADQVFLCRRPA